MIECSAIETLLDDHLAGRLPEEESLVVARHLQDCKSCRQRLESLSEIRRLAQGLPSELEPSRDLWPEIASQISKPIILTIPGWFSSQRIIRFIIAAAACLMVATGSVVLFEYGSRSNIGTDISADSTPILNDGMLVEIAKAEKTYCDATEHFIADLDADKNLLTPEARTILDGNLAIADQAISEVKSVLKTHPTDCALARKLLANYELRIELLQQATQLSFAVRNGG